MSLLNVGLHECQSHQGNVQSMTVAKGKGKVPSSWRTYRNGFPSSFLFPSICIWTFTRSVGLARNWPTTPAIIPPITDFLITKGDTFFLHVAINVMNFVGNNNMLVLPLHKRITTKWSQGETQTNHRGEKMVCLFTNGRVQGPEGVKIQLWSFRGLPWPEIQRKLMNCFKEISELPFNSDCRGQKEHWCNQSNRPIS